MPFPHSLHIADAPAAATAFAAGLLVRTVATRPDAVLGLATGGTMRGVYAGLLRLAQAGEIALGSIRAFNLDEYLGLGHDDPNAYAAEMRRIFFAPAGIAPAQTDIPDGTAPDPAAEAMRYEAAIAASGGIDCQLLGLGINGHIGFNEPGAPFDLRTRVVDLAPETIAANASHFPPGRPVPHRAITMGIATILDARRIVLVATGAAKADAVHAMLAGPRHPACPASALQAHPQVDIVLDRAAAARLPAP